MKIIFTVCEKMYLLQCICNISIDKIDDLHIESNMTLTLFMDTSKFTLTINKYTIKENIEVK